MQVIACVPSSTLYVRLIYTLSHKKAANLFLSVTSSTINRF